MRNRLSILVGAAILCPPAAARAALVVDYFNGYGSTDVNLPGKGAAGDGWAGAWAGSTSPNYHAAQLNYAGTGYSNAGNGSGSTDGRAHEGGGDTTNVATRSLAVPMTGSVWVSALMNDEGAADFAAALVFDVGNPTNSLVRIVEQGTDTDQRSTSYNGVENQPAAGVGMGAYVDGSVGLMLARIDMNHNASGHDRLTAWFNPDLTGGLSTIGPGFVAGETLDVFGPTFDGVGVAFSRGNGAIDSIRISDDADGFNQVITGVPEPTSAAVVGVGVAGLLLGRRRGRRSH